MEKISRPGMGSALFCVALISQINGQSLQMEQIRHRFDTGADTLAPIELARVFTEIGLKARPAEKPPAQIKAAMLPAALQTRSGEYVILAKLDADQGRAFIQRMGSGRGQWVSVGEWGELYSGSLVLVSANGQAARPSREFGLFWFLKASMKYWGTLRDCLLASFFVQIFALFSPLVFMLIIDKVLNHNSLSTLDVLIIALIVVSAFEVLLGGLRAYLLSHTANRIDLSLGIKVFQHLLSLPLSFFESRRVGDIIARMRELETVRQFITGSGLMLFLDLIFVVVFLAVIFMFSTYLSMIVVIVMPFLFLASFFITPILRNRLEDKYSIGAENQSFLVEAISGIETVKSNAAEPRMQDKWEERFSAYIKSGFNSGHLSNVTSQVTTTISKVLTVALLWLGAKEVLAGDLTVGQLIAFNMLSARVVAPILRLSQVWKEFQQVKVSIARIGDILNSPTEPVLENDRTSMPPIQGRVEFQNVTFRYRPDGPEILSDVSFKVEPGEVIGIVGSTGSGKTTLVKLLQRLYVPERGRVLVDGVDLSLADATWLRRQTGVVVQNGVMFNGSIKDNITLNNPRLTIEEIIEAATLAGAHEFIAGLPMGYDTLVGERGCRLSTGQNQRIAIARALAGDPRMLILDEATSALDYESEQTVQQNMKKISEGRTVFIVAHRLSTVRHADRILTLENGRVVEDDAPAVLLQGNGRYAQLHRLHAG